MALTAMEQKQIREALKAAAAQLGVAAKYLPHPSRRGGSKRFP